MKVILAPDSFKESMTAKEACIAIEEGFKKVFPDATFIHAPMADGGEGTVQSLVDATGGRILYAQVTDPLGESRFAKFGIMGDGLTCAIEMATASGLELVPREKRNPLKTTTYGTGELIHAALDQGIRKILIGIGGSATNDGGAGMVQALGARLLDKDGNELGFGGGELAKLDRIDISGLDERLKETEVIVACDVNNPLTGDTGASRIFGPQKGATEEMVRTLDANLRHYAEVIRRDLDKDVEDVPGAGAAGGLGAGLMAFLNASLNRGVDMVIDYTRLWEKMQDADLVITGEGGMDAQTRFGKAPFGVARTAKQYNLPVIAIAGNVKEDSEILYEHGFDAIFSATHGASSLEDCLLNGKNNLKRVSENIARLIKSTHDLNLK